MLRKILLFWSFYLLILCAGLLYILPSQAQEPLLINLDQLSLDYKYFHGSARNPLFYDSTPKEAIGLTMNTDILGGIIFWDNLVHTTTNSAQYYHIGWNFKLGTRITQSFSLQYEHHSQHLLDTTYPYQKFPVEDSLGFTLQLYRPHDRGLSWF